MSIGMVGVIELFRMCNLLSSDPRVVAGVRGAVSATSHTGGHHVRALFGLGRGPVKAVSPAPRGRSNAESLDREWSLSTFEFGLRLVFPASPETLSVMWSST